MNPFSRYLSQWSTDTRFDAFVEHWDVLERIVISVHREMMTPEAAAADYERAWGWLRGQYPLWRAALEPYWRQTRAAGAATAVDPFQLLLDIGRPADILGNWRAMQHLPAAREAINRYLLDHSTPDEPAA
jgi:hypothetical protein